MIPDRMAMRGHIRRSGGTGWWHWALAILAVGIALLWLLFGSTGLFAWNDYNRELRQREAQLVRLREEHQVLLNHQRLLDPKRSDPDLGEELVREELNLVHPDDVVVVLPKR